MTCFFGASNLLFTYVFFLLWIAHMMIQANLDPFTGVSLDHLDEVLRSNLEHALQFSMYLAFFFAMVYPLSKISCCLFQLLPKREKQQCRKEYFQKWVPRLGTIALRSSGVLMATWWLIHVATLLPSYLNYLIMLILSWTLILSGITAMISLAAYLLIRLYLWILSKMEQQQSEKEYFQKWVSRLGAIALRSSGVLMATWWLSYVSTLLPADLSYLIVAILFLPIVISLHLSGIIAMISLAAYLLMRLYVWGFARIEMSTAHKRKVSYLNYTLYAMASAFQLYVYFYHYPTL